jgi:gamma-glutamylcyclotransferase (GGCT)/AIG2-like uncharacterized protein YtfP
MRTWLYFAYGSNLDFEGMAARCPDREPVAPAILTDWALTFRGVADIERHPSAVVHGALWRISARDLDRLDAYEGHPGLYRRELVAVHAAGSAAKALVYVMNEDYLGLPSRRYYECIKRGYEQWGLPVEALERALATVKNRLFDLGIRSFEPDGPKRLRPSAA